MKMITAIVNKKDAGSVCDAHESGIFFHQNGDDGRIFKGGKYDAVDRHG